MIFMNGNGYMPSEDWNKNWSLNQSKLFRYLLDRTTEYYHKVIAQMFEKNGVKGKTILELGCGTADDTFWLMRKFKYKKGTVVDFSDEALKKVDRAKGNLDITLVNQNILNLRLKSKYNLVHSGFVIEHFYGKNRLLAIKKHAEFVSKDCYVFIQAPGKTILSLLYSKTINKINGIEELLYSKQELLSLIKKSNLKIIDLKSLFGGAIFFVLASKE